MTDLSALLSCVENASGPDSELAREIWEALTGECTHRNTHFVELENDERELECSDCGADTYGKEKWRSILFSVDATIALAERVLPGCGWSIISPDPEVDWHIFTVEIWTAEHRFCGQAAVAHYAFLAAIIKAAMETQK